MVNYLPLSSRHMEVNVENIWKKNKMDKGLKINLPLGVGCWMTRRFLG